MISHQFRRAPFLIALVFVLLLLLNGWDASTILRSKAAAQETVTEGVYQWRQSYMALREVLGQWEKKYRRDDSIQDLISLYAMVGLDRYGLRTNADNVILNTVEPIVQNNLHIGLTKICLISTRGADHDSLLVEAHDYETLFRGLSQLADQPDIFIGKISIKGDSTLATANLGDFCILLRTSQS